MIHFDSALTTDPMTLLILATAVVGVLSLHFYLQRLIGKGSHSVPVPVTISPEVRSARSVADERHTNR